MEIIDHCVEKNPPEYNIDKAMEECIEFQEVLIKLRTKNATNPRRPKEVEALKEFGDVIYRGIIALRTIFPDANLEDILLDVNEHINKKLSRLGEFKKEGKYAGGL